MASPFSAERIYQFLIVGLVLLVLWKWNCAKQNCPPIKETVRIDTVWKDRADSSPWTKPLPVAVKPGKVPTVKPQIIYRPGTNTFDTLWMPVDTAAILSDYYAVRDYDTAYQFAEAEIRIQNYVSENALQGQRVLPTFHTAEITKTITQAVKQRGQVYLGIEAFGGKEFPLYGAGGNIMYKTKKDRVYEVGAVAFRDQQLMFKAGFKFKL